MKLARFDNDRIGIVVDEESIVDVTDACGVASGSWPPVAMTQVVARFDELRNRLVEAATHSSKRQLAEVKLHTPIPWPNKVIAFPVNYHAHGVEMAAPYRASSQGFFLKPNSALSGASDPIVLPNLPGRAIHHECELGIVIGRTGRCIPEDRWREYVFGYACLIDMVVRGKEERVMRKAFDTFCPVGPWITTADEIDEPAGLQSRLWVNDELRQDANTRDLVVGIPGMIAMASAVMTLYPGDIIASGTPEGVGPVKHGDRVRIEIERVGAMTLSVVQGERGFTPVLGEHPAGST